MPLPYLYKKSVMSKKIAIIGGGNLGASIADGLIYSEFSRPVEIAITRRNLAPLSRFAERGCMVQSDNKKAVQNSEVIILAVKPYNYEDIIKEIRPALNPKKHVIVSVITGVWIDQLQKAIGKPVPVIRAMPNTAIAIQHDLPGTCRCHQTTVELCAGII
jgi:pyrroline-5-carboxylate reductase